MLSRFKNWLGRVYCWWFHQGNYRLDGYHDSAGDLHSWWTCHICARQHNCWPRYGTIGAWWPPR